MSENNSWYDTGYDGVNKAEANINQLGGPRRFWIKAGTSAEFVFVDDEPFAIYEHNPKMNGNFRNWVTCVKGIYEDTPCCDEIGEKTRYYIGYYTVIDCSKWTDNKGNSHQYEVKFLPAKLKSLKKFKRKKEDRQQDGKGGLAGCLYKATREDGKSPNIGDEFEFQKDADMGKLLTLANYNGKKLTELFTKAAEDPNSLAALQKVFAIKLDPHGKVLPTIPQFNYVELLKPKSAKDLRNMLKGNVEKDDGDGPTSGTGADESVPF